MSHLLSALFLLGSVRVRLAVVLRDADQSGRGAGREVGSPIFGNAVSKQHVRELR